VYREILTSLSSPKPSPPKEKASLLTMMSIVGVVGIFVAFGMSITRIETRDLRPMHPSPIVSIYDKGVIRLNGMFIKTNLFASLLRKVGLCMNMFNGIKRQLRCVIK
jgi:hypothetical protein